MHALLREQQLRSYCCRNRCLTLTVLVEYDLEVETMQLYWVAHGLYSHPVCCQSLERAPGSSHACVCRTLGLHRATVKHPSMADPAQCKHCEPESHWFQLLLRLSRLSGSCWCWLSGMGRVHCTCSQAWVLSQLMHMSRIMLSSAWAVLHCICMIYMADARCSNVSLRCFECYILQSLMTDGIPDFQHVELSAGQV